MPPVTGSSPLTRGKPSRAIRARARGGLIPAHAGKTATSCARCPPTTAHPRSRGENRPGQRGVLHRVGSSPLTRGKRVLRATGHGIHGLIPAHAGKTDAWTRGAENLRAHPRSRGENAFQAAKKVAARGSSPLTRGKLDADRGSRGRGQLIPAHAGKTVVPAVVGEAGRAHPRSRGENQIKRSGLSQTKGSSPLTRGKRGEAGRDDPRAGLIPAHAGKTNSTGS